MLCPTCQRPTMEVNGRHYDTNPTPALVIDRIENDWMHAPTVYPLHQCRTENMNTAGKAGE